MSAEDLISQSKTGSKLRKTLEPGLHIFAKTNNDETRARKFQNPPRKLTIQYDSSGDNGLFHQYAELKNTLSYNVWGLQSIEYRPGTPTVLAHRGRHCLGGAQIIVSSPREPITLPCERDGFKLQKSLPDLNLYKVTYGEIADFAALPEYQDGMEIVELFHRVVMASVGAGVQYLFMVSPLPQVNRWCIAAQTMSMSCHILRNVTLPDYDEFGGGRAFLTLIDLTMMQNRTEY